MTTIVFAENKNGFVAGCDTQVTSGHTKFPLAEGKIIRKGNYVYGVAGLLMFIDTLRNLEFPTPEPGEDVETFIRTTFVKFLFDVEQEMLTEIGIDVKSPDAYRYRSEMILGVLGGKNSKVFLVEPMTHFVTRRADKVYATGSGGDYALAALRSTNKRDENAIRHALEAASALDLYTSAPYFIKTYK